MRVKVEDLGQYPPHVRAQIEAQMAGKPAPAPTATQPASFRVEHLAKVPSPPKPNKYGNRKVEFEGQKYDSELELEMCQHLVARWIGNPCPMAFPKDVLWFIRQPKYVLEGGVVYIADAMAQIDHEPWYEVWDAKGLFLQASKNKIKQMLDRYGIEVKLWRRSQNP